MKEEKVNYGKRLNKDQIVICQWLEVVDRLIRAKDLNQGIHIVYYKHFRLTLIENSLGL